MKPPTGTDEGPEGDPAMADPPNIGTRLAYERARGRDSGEGGGGDGPLEGRVSRLEAYAETARDDLREIRGDLKAIIAKLGTFPTKTELDTWKWQWLLGSVALFAVVIGSIIAGLSWLDS